MTLTDICTTYETSLKLKEAGFDASTDFYWMGDESNECHLICDTDAFQYVAGHGIYFDAISEDAEPLFEIRKLVKAYTFEHIWWNLPSCVELTPNEAYVLVEAQCPTYTQTSFDIEDGLAEAAALAWLWCKEKGYVK